MQECHGAQRMLALPRLDEAGPVIALDINAFLSFGLTSSLQEAQSKLHRDIHRN